MKSGKKILAEAFGPTSPAQIDEHTRDVSKISELQTVCLLHTCYEDFSEF